MRRDDLYELAARMVEARGLGIHSEVAAAWFRGRKTRHFRWDVVGIPEPEHPGEGSRPFFTDAAPCRRQEAVYRYAVAGRPDLAIQWVKSRRNVCADCNCPLPVPS